MKGVGVFLAVLLVVSSAWAQRTGGSFGGSSWGSRTSSSPTRVSSLPVVRDSWSPSRTVYRSVPTPRVDVRPSGRVVRGSSPVRPQVVVAPVVMVSHDEDSDGLYDEAPRGEVVGPDGPCYFVS